MSLESVMRRAFDGVNAYDPDLIMSCWSPIGIYDNPGVGPAGHGYDAVRACMVKLCDAVRQRGEQLVVDRITVGPRHVIAEWHVVPSEANRHGVHVADFDDQDRLVHVRVYPRS